MRICFVGAMLGRHPGFGMTQGMVLAEHFEKAGHQVVATSAVKNRYLRLLDILITLFRTRRVVDVQCLEIYGGPSFVVEDCASWLAVLFGQRLIMVLHGGALPEFVARHPRWAARVLRRADTLVAPSPFLVKAASRWGFNAKVIPNVIDLEMYPYRQRRELRPRLFWMRAFHPLWNPEMALRAFAEVRKRLPDAVMVMGGQDKGSRAEMQRLAQQLHVEDAVKFPGFLDMDAKVRAGDAADIFLNTNRVDNMPVAIVEAGAMGLPVVSTSVGGVPDLLTDGQSGLLVPDNDHEAMTEAVFRLLNDPELAARLSAGGRRVAEQSAWETVRPQWERVFTASTEAMSESIMVDA